MTLFISIIAALNIVFIVLVSVADTSCVLSNGTAVPVQQHQLCCGRDLHHKYVNGSEQVCCGGKLYPKKEVICCGNTPIPFEGDNVEDYDCCGMTPYKTDEKECCNNQLLKPEQICCNERVHTYEDGGECCGNDFFHTPDTHYCFNDQKVIPIGKKLCDGTEYNPDTDICCDDIKLHRNISNIRQYECCGLLLTNKDIEECVWDPPHNIPRGSRPCGQGHYYDTRQRCCLDVVVNITRSSQDCCGRTLYDKANSRQCCLPVEKEYNKSTHKCCGSTLNKGALASLHQDEDCCGHEKYDTKSSVCCQLDEETYYTITKNQTRHDECCPSTIKGRSISYFNQWEICVPGQEPRITKKPVCGNENINESSDLCCNNELYRWKKSEGFLCCDQGYRIFHPSTQICCNTVVYNISEKQSCFQEIPSPSKLCSWCNIGLNTAIHQIKEHKLTICKQTAIKLKTLSWSQNGEVTSLEGKIDKDIYNVGFLRKRIQRLVIPCQCQIKTRNVIVITNKQLRGGVRRLDDQDLVLPFSGRLKRLLTAICPLDVVNNIREDIGYLLNKVERVRNRLLGQRS